MLFRSDRAQKGYSYKRQVATLLTAVTRYVLWPWNWCVRGTRCLIKCVAVRPQIGQRFILSFIGTCVWPISIVLTLRNESKAFWWVDATQCRLGVLRRWCAKGVEYQILTAIGMRNAGSISETLVKLLAGLEPFFIVFWVYLAASMNAPLPHCHLREMRGSRILRLADSSAGLSINGVPIWATQ